DAPWGIFIAPDQRIPGYETFSYFHPAFFYESVLNLFLFSLLYSLLQRKRPLGSVTMLYFIGYGVIRFFMDFVRIDPMPLFAGLRFSQWISIVFIFTSVFFLLKQKTAHHWRDGRESNF
ncbi:MAG: prolipoprotein diacylglyceryl transferase, partial [Candidatus Komeilibacteria bacterium]|nr:prolipoprotein diacylglyceryl transferase [Candidatus Komeilibacteria bacterium]